MADDDDYMSDKFISNTETYTPPGLILHHSTKRAISLTKRKAEADLRIKNKNKLKCTMEQEKREEALSRPLSVDNKGFGMMLKMGYMPGEGIGKNQSGPSEPIHLDIKLNRSGLGSNKEKPAVINVEPKLEINDIKTNEFRDRMALKKLAQLAEIDLIKSQKVCEQFDIDNNISEPVESWYWPDIIEEKSCDIDKNEDCDTEENKNKKQLDKVEIENDHVENDGLLNSIPTETKLANITIYLREKYFYCIWCGVSYIDENDLNENCPGNTRHQH